MLSEYLSRFWDLLIRWRTWLVNSVFVVILTPEIVFLLLNFDWGVAIPPKYMGVVLVIQALLNIWMRPRPAARKYDPEVQYKISTRKDE